MDFLCFSLLVMSFNKTKRRTSCLLDWNEVDHLCRVSLFVCQGINVVSCARIPCVHVVDYWRQLIGKIMMDITERERREPC